MLRRLLLEQPTSSKTQEAIELAVTNFAKAREEILGALN